jgi:hypothetical protein
MQWKKPTPAQMKRLRINHDAVKDVETTTHKGRRVFVFEYVKPIFKDYRFGGTVAGESSFIGKTREEARVNGIKAAN